MSDLVVHGDKPYVVRCDPILRFKKGIIETLSRCRTTGSDKLRGVKASLEKHTGISLAKGEATESHIDIPIRPSWVHGHVAALEYYTLLVTFGSHYTDCHVEEAMRPGLAYLVSGEKTWRFYHGSSLHNRDGVVQQQPFAVITQTSGDCVYVPSGVWHSVKTTSNGAVMIGCETPADNIACLRALRDSVGQLRHIMGPERVQKEADMVLGQIRLPVYVRGTRRPDRTPHFFGSKTRGLVAGALARECGGTTRRNMLGIKRARGGRPFASRKGSRKQKVNENVNQRLLFHAIHVTHMYFTSVRR